jgi:hypothetical protein
MIWCIAGLHDPKWLSNIWENFDRQTYLGKRLVIVENGLGVGHGGSWKATVLQSEKGAAQPLNAGLRYIRSVASADDKFCKFDADDYYGPEYLSGIAESKTDYCGRSSLYIRTTNDRLWFAQGDSDAYVFHGPSIAGKVWGEDAEWCLAMHREGRNCEVLKPEGLCYQRHANNEHAWPVTDSELRGSWGVEFFDLGEFDRLVVDGILERPRESLGIAEFSFENFMPARVLRERLGSSLR